MAKSRQGRSAGKFNFGKAFMGNLVALIVAGFPYLTSFGFVGALFGASYAFAVQSDLFVLRKVTLEDGKPLTEGLAYYFAGLRLGEPMFKVNLNQSERVIRSRHPEYKWVSVKRVLPDEVRIVLREKIPLAQIHHDSYYLLDFNGMIISEPSKEPFAKVPVIRGVEIREKNLGRGTRLNRQALNQVAQLLRDIKRFDILRGHELTALDIGDKNNYLLWLDGKIEVRIAARDFTSQLKKFSDALANIDMDPDKICYIDLRFDDIVIGPR